MAATRLTGRIAGVLSLLVALLLVAAPAWAHVTVDPAEAAADSYAKLTFRVPHGCDGAPTETVRVQIPDGVVSVKPQVVAGWEIETVIGEYDEPVELHGNQVTEGVKEVVWSGGSLSDEHLEEFGMSVKLPPGEGETLVFPAVQECPGGASERWVEVAEDGEDAHELEHPAPTVTLTGAGGHGDGYGGDDADQAEGGDDAGQADSGEDEAVAADDQVQTAATAPSNGPLVWVALIAGLLGAALGATAMATRRR